ncbi:hypothetical protein Bca101_020264 [Brassica carinata]
MIAEIYEALDYSENEYYRKFDEIYFPFDNSIATLHSRTEGMDKDIKAIQRQLATRPLPYTSTDMPPHASISEGTMTSIDPNATASSIQDKMIQRLDSMQAELSDLSEHAYRKIGWHAVSIESHEERIQRITDELIELKEKRTREYEATRSLIDAWFGEKKDTEDTCFLTSTWTSSQ